ncbi:superoxide dismutase [Millisia brevis]|uniref:superoxide dismutase n=1 Tax=Millisia brevis TaxID=264148 RepID=UPI00082D6BDA|nr:superoxide dismutase [Millisia brevis]
MTVYTLPDLPYDYAALEPHISGKIMELHHSKHHQAYVTGANAALDKLAEARDSGDFANVNKLEKDLAFNLGGHLNHSVFWQNLSPEGGGNPEGDLAVTLDENFGSFATFRDHFTATALGVQGSGWAILGWDALSRRPLVFQLYDQQSNVPVGITPLLQLDVWEHAYYLDYLNVRADYIKAFWEIVNWDDVSRRYKEAVGGN